MFTLPIFKSNRVCKSTSTGRLGKVFFRIILPLFLLSSPATFSASGNDATNVIPEFIPATENDIFTGDLEKIRERRILRVLVTNSRTDFFLDEGRIRGVQAELTHELLKYLNAGIKRESDKLFVQFTPVEYHQLLPALKAGKGDIAAAFLTITPQREQLVDFITSQDMKVDEVLIANKNAPPISTITQLSGKQVYILKGSNYPEHLQRLNRQLEIIGIKPANIVEADKSLLTEDLLELINAGVIDYAICDDYKAELWQQVLPNLTILDDVDVSTGKLSGWAIRKNSPQLKKALEKFNRSVRKGTLIGNVLFKKYLANTRWLAETLGEAERDKRQRVTGLFEKYGAIYGFDPLALAAQAYQESKLNNNAKSHKGAIGIMQLLPATARDPNVAIDDVELLENNIHAGVKYLRFLRERYFSGEEIDPWDQRLFAWAAYNAGPANVIRIRAAARLNGLDPNIWFGNVEVMAARMISREPVRYVANIHKFYTAYRMIEEQALQRQFALESQLDNLDPGLTAI